MTVPGPVPPTRREDVVDRYHGTAVADPYRWLEDGDDPEVIAWAAAQNAFTRSVIDALPGRARWHERLVALMQLPVVLEATRRGDHLFTVERPAGAEQFRLARRSAADPGVAPVTLADPGAEAADAANAVDWFAPSRDGSLVAIGTSEGGTERSTLRVVSGIDGTPAGTADDEIPDTRACSVAWEPDGSGFFYTRYPEGDEYHRTVHHHRLGTPWAQDPVVWAEHPDPQAWPQVALSPDGRWLLVEVTCGWSRVDIHVLDRSNDAWVTLVAGVEAPTELTFDADGTALVGVTHIEASRGRVVRVALDHDALAAGPAAWDTLVPERDDVISAFGVGRDGLYMVTSRAALDTIWTLDADGTSPQAVAGLPDAVAVAGLATDRRRAGRLRAARLLHRARPPPGGWRGMRRPSRGAMSPATRRRSPAPFASRRPRTGRSTAPRWACSSCTGPTSPRRRPRRRSSTATAASPSRRRRRSSPTPRRGARRAACSPSPACAAAGSTARRGTSPAIGPTSRTSSTTSRPPPTTSSPKVSPAAIDSPSTAARTAACSSGRPSPSGPTCAVPSGVACRCST